MKTRLYLPEDYDTVKAWWPAHGWPEVPEPVLPKLGVIVDSDEGVPLVAGWLYMSNSNGVAMMEWTVTNPVNTPMTSLRAISVLIGAIRILALEHDYGFILTSVKNKALCRHYERSGFRKSDEGVTHLMMFTNTCPS